MNRQSSALANVSIAVAATLVGFLLYAVRDVVTLVACAALAALVATPAIDRLRTNGIGSWHPSYLESLLSLAAVGLACFLLVSTLPPPSQVVDAISSLSVGSVAGALRDTLAPANLKSFSRETVFSLAASGLGTWVFAGLFAFVAWIAISNGWFARAAARLPESTRPAVIATRLPASAQSGWDRSRNWLASGGGSSAVIIGAASWLLFQFIDLRHADVLALVIGGGALLPFPGLLAAIVLTAVIAAFDSVRSLIGVLTFFGLYSWLEARYVKSRLDRLDLSVGTVLGATAAGIVVGHLWGATFGIAVALLAGALIRSRQGYDGQRAAASPHEPRGLVGEVVDLVVDTTTALAPAWKDVLPANAVRSVGLALAALIAFHILGVRHAYLLAVLVGLGSMIPVVGPPGALLVCAVVAGADSTLKLFGVLVFFTAVHQVGKALRSQRPPAQITDARPAVVAIPMEFRAPPTPTEETQGGPDDRR